MTLDDFNSLKVGDVVFFIDSSRKILRLTVDKVRRHSIQFLVDDGHYFLLRPFLCECIYRSLSEAESELNKLI